MFEKRKERREAEKFLLHNQKYVISYLTGIIKVDSGISSEEIKARTDAAALLLGIKVIK